MIQYNSDGTIIWDQGTIGAFAPIIRDASGAIISVDNSWSARITIHPAVGKQFIHSINGVIIPATIAGASVNMFSFNILQTDMRNVKFGVGEMEANLMYQLDVAKDGTTISLSKISHACTPRIADSYLDVN